MRLKTILRYIEVLLIVGTILTPIIFYFTPLSIFDRFASFGFKELLFD
ncbi:MAG: hypothetical protein HGN29_03475 [Asgard group archaeon]|nr:hypothetical protein [Asgard group archaeon]